MVSNVAWLLMDNVQCGGADWRCVSRYQSNLESRCNRDHSRRMGWDISQLAELVLCAGGPTYLFSSFPLSLSRSVFLTVSVSSSLSLSGSVSCLIFSLITFPLFSAPPPPLSLSLSVFVSQSLLCLCFFLCLYPFLSPFPLSLSVLCMVLYCECTLIFSGHMAA